MKYIDYYSDLKEFNFRGAFDPEKFDSAYYIDYRGKPTDSNKIQNWKPLVSTIIVSGTSQNLT